MKNIILSCMKFIYFFGLMMIVCSKQVSAYIDPSTVTYLVQIVAAVFVAIGAALTVYRHKIVSFFKGTKKDENQNIVEKNDSVTEDANGVVDIQLDEE